jgi:hypothetical protein
MRILGNTASSYATELYSFTTATFTPGGATGQNGPNITQARTAVNQSWVDLYLNMTTNGIQQWTVPATGTYRFTVAGANGGNGSTIGTPGSGAILRGDVVLTMGQVLNIVVGQSGGSAGVGLGRGGGGGGASFVYSGSSSGTGLIFAAGGGGGVDDGGGTASSARTDLLPTLDGAGTTQTHNGLGGTGAQGGNGSGWLATPTVGTNNGSLFVGGAGSEPAANFGGFGGAGGDVDDGGAGAGFTGGGSSANASGGAGGSYYPGFTTAASFTSIWQSAFSNYTFVGTNAASGSVIVTKL